MIKRETVLKRIRPFYESDLIKVLIGLRRSGKSVILQQIQDLSRDQTASYYQESWQHYCLVVM